MPTFNAGKGADAQALKRELAEIPNVTVEADTQGNVTVDVPDVRHLGRVQYVTRQHVGRALVQRVRTAKPGTPEARDAIADALAELFEV